MFQKVGVKMIYSNYLENGIDNLNKLKHEPVVQFVVAQGELLLPLKILSRDATSEATGFA